MVTTACPIETIQEAAERMFPRCEASQTDVVSYVWEHWERLSQLPLAMALAHGRQFAWRQRRKERSPLSRSTEAIDRHCPARTPEVWPQELIESLPSHLRLVAVLLATGHDQRAIAEMLGRSPATINRRCNQIRAFLRRS